MGRIDYAVIGGGVAGAYAAWRLATEPGRRTVHLFEETGRIGGRLLTLPIPRADFNAELGAMRYTSNQLILRNLVKHLGLQEVPFDVRSRLMYVRGYRVRPGDHHRSLPYKLEAEELAVTPDPVDLPLELVRLAIRRALCDVTLPRGVHAGEMKELTGEMKELKRRLKVLKAGRCSLSRQTLTARQWALLSHHASLGSAERSRLYEVGFWNLLQHYLSTDGFFLVRDGLGYESIVANWNVGEAIPWFLADFGADYFTVGDGMQKVVFGLAKQFQARRGALLRYNSRLVRIEEGAGGPGPRGLKLTFAVRSGTRGATRAEVVYAKHVVLAVPKQGLTRISFRVAGWPSERDWTRLLASVTEHALFKLFLGYRRAWWRRGGAAKTKWERAVTDLPLRQIYYSSPARKLSPGVLMASYSDEHYVDYWKAPLVRKGTEYHYKGPLSDIDREILRVYGASKRLVAKAQRQLCDLHAEVKRIPFPYVALAKAWTGELGDWGWHSWNPHTRPWEVIRALRRPSKANNVYICGEAYSCEQGWVEGALRSAEMVLKELGLGPPGWVSNQNYTLRGFEGYEEYIGW